MKFSLSLVSRLSARLQCNYHKMHNKECAWGNSYLHKEERMYVGERNESSRTTYKTYRHFKHV